MTADIRKAYVVQGSRSALDRRIIHAIDSAGARAIATGSFGMSVVSVREIRKAS